METIDAEELGEIRAAVREGQEQVNRGETTSAEEFERYIRTKYGIPR